MKTDQPQWLNFWERWLCFGSWP